MKENFFSQKNIKIISVIILVISFLPFLLLYRYVHPSADDFNYTNIFLDKGLIGSQIFWYKAWSGRYIGNIILSLNPLIFHKIALYKITLFFIPFLLIYSMYFIVNQVFTKLEFWKKLLISLWVISVYFSFMPKTSTALYWWAGTGTYQTGIIFFLFTIGNLIKYYNTKILKYLWISIFFLFLTIGTNETVMFMMDILLGMGFVILFIYSKKQTFIKNHKYYLILLFAALAFSLIVILAPGNAIRSSYFPNKHKLNSFYRSYMMFKENIEIWLPIVSIFGLFFINFIVKKQYDIAIKIFSINPIFLFFTSIIITYLGFFPGFWSMGAPPPDRTVNVVYFFFVFTWFIFILNLYFFFIDKNNDNKIPDFINVTLIIIIFVWLIKPTSNVSKAFLDIKSKKAYRYDRALNDRYRLIKQFDKNKAVFNTPKLKVIPKTIFFRDVTPNPKDWRNNSYAKYWGLKSIKAVDNK